MTQQVQKRNAQMVDLLRPDFQHRREPNYAWSRAVSMYQALPGLRAFWPMSSVLWLAANQTIDIGGQLNYLTNNNTALFGYDSLAPYVEFDGVNQYLSRADGGAGNWADVTGTEAYIVAAQRGLTVGGWFNFDRAPGVVAERMIGKDDPAVNQRSYMTLRSGGGNLRFGVSLNGIAFTQVNASNPPQNTGQWYFIVGRFVPGVSIDVFVDSTLTQNLVAIPASIFDSTTPFTIGITGDLVSSPFDGKASMCFLCAAQLSDAIILSLYEQTRAMYGV